MVVEVNPKTAKKFLEQVERFNQTIKVESDKQLTD